MVAIVVILAATISVYGLGFADDITGPDPSSDSQVVSLFLKMVMMGVSSE
ncbi:hypothetical protein [Halorubrum saccharovorum]|nr:hypothetical protein [Halorubrum saccharovorum]